MPWDDMLALAVTDLKMSPRDFWNLSFTEWFAIYNRAFGKTKPMSVTDSVLLEEAWINGDFRRTGNKN